LYIVVSVGSRNEVEPGKSGFAHLFEHMMFRGTDKYPPAKYQAVLQDAGAASNAYTTDDRTVYHAVFSREDLDRILEMEADRFRNLSYPEPDFRTEALAVLGEYNKNSQSPDRKLFEVLRDTAFDRHTYKHTTMGFLGDIEDMPNQYEYSLQFHDRWYRPEYTTIIVVGDVRPETTREMVKRYWGDWPRGSYSAEIPAEPPQKGARRNHVNWPSPTLPWLAIAHRGAAYSDTGMDQVSLDVLAFLAFSESSDLYRRLVIEEQKVDLFGFDNPDRLDPQLFTVVARIKQIEDLDYIRDAILATIAGFEEKPVEEEKLEQVKKYLRYSFAASLDNSEAVASTLAAYVGLRRTPETINKVYALYEQVTPDDVQRVARTYFTEEARTIVTLAQGESR
jgi:zinc protease